MQVLAGKGWNGAAAGPSNAVDTCVLHDAAYPPRGARVATRGSCTVCVCVCVVWCGVLMFPAVTTAMMCGPSPNITTTTPVKYRTYFYRHVSRALPLTSTSQLTCLLFCADLPDQIADL
ncbi:hypothetical protein P280DRAFT_15902 [Massarina eburnea CBS 473.64]|uniref:Uncharacterized protein n=1 Tax=Massarina eburnea CBS 473.64 TaxID=1395130 RepID=A0A6A6SI37_9PLEO|nr:hypothetical protein P280DRAFT_15902 [Massarina eburnea CBS 473.64]